MIRNAGFHRRWMSLPIALAAALTACGGGSSGSSNQPPAGNGGVSPTVQSSVTVSGKVRYERVPFALLVSGLDYLRQAMLPARGITVQAVNAANQEILSSASTNATGDFSLTVPQGTNVAIQAVAQMGSFRVLDVETMQQPYTYTGAAFASGSTASTQNLDIPSGWNSAGLATGTRASAPFSILDTVAKGRDLILSVAPTAVFPPLTLDWAPTNAGGQTFYENDGGGDNRKIVLSGEADLDTDEFDEHVIAHELGHYIEDQFSRSDSLGGPHAPGDRLDPRVAFGEGFGYAFAAMVLGDPVVRDSVGANQADETRFNIENDSLLNEGWYSEGSVQEVLWDLFDSAVDGPDVAMLGFAPIWQVLTGAQRDTDAATGIFSFIEALKLQTGQAAQIDPIVTAEKMAALTMNAFAVGETNDAGRGSDVLPIYTPIAIGGDATVRSIGDGSGSTTQSDNKLSAHRFLRLDVPGTQSVRITATAAPSGRDVDIRVLYRGEQLALSEGSGDENFTLTLQPGTYVLDTYDCGNAGCDASAPAPVDITVNVVPN